MTMVRSVRTVLSKYLTVRGRAGRPEFWWWVLVYATVVIVFAEVDLSFDEAIFGNMQGMPRLPLASAAFLGLLPAHVTVCARRLHDVGCSAWLLAVGLVPVVGQIILLWYFTKPSVEAVNRHGRPPEGITYF
ncbi:MAG: uncharacterized membrane protein YhaH (DUF805 family) [Paracoccaceae bacterium]